MDLVLLPKYCHVGQLQRAAHVRQFAKNNRVKGLWFEMYYSLRNTIGPDINVIGH